MLNVRFLNSKIKKCETLRERDEVIRDYYLSTDMSINEIAFATGLSLAAVGFICQGLSNADRYLREKKGKTNAN